MQNQSAALTWTGRALSGFVAVGLAMSAVMKLTQSPELVEAFAKYGYSPGAIQPLGAIELTCAILFVIPQTSVFAAILMVGYLGGATATHVIAGEPFFAPVLMGVAAWTGLSLREPRLRELLPLRRG